MAISAPDAGAPLLRSPPFPGVDASVSRPAVGTPPADPATVDDLFASIRDARVGGSFWLPAGSSGARRLVRGSKKRRPMGNDVMAVGDIDPWSVLNRDVHLDVHGDDEWAALAHIAGATVDILSEGRFGKPGSPPSEIRANVIRALYGATYRDPFTGQPADIGEAVARLADWLRMFKANERIVAACGMAWWKRHEIARFLWSPTQKLRFFRSERRAVAYAAKRSGSVAVWPSRISPRLVDQARAANVPIVQIEDGFVRSVGLGSNLVPPSSIAVDRQGIHYDPTYPSDLETLLANTDFPPRLLQRAQALRKVILDGGIGKYGAGDDHMFPERQPGRRLVLVPGQVEDDMSVRLGGGGLTSNLELLRRVRALEPDAEIWFRPHPDVDAGHRKGKVADQDALLHANRVVRGGAMARLLDRVDAVHVLTSLTGFEALMRGLDVTCHGTPFYAGWGLTRDLGEVPDRRGRALTLDQLVAGVLVLYARYLDPVTGLPCPPEVLVTRMTDGTARNRLGWVTRVRQWQGRLTRLFA